MLIQQEFNILFLRHLIVSKGITSYHPIAPCNVGRDDGKNMAETLGIELCQGKQLRWQRRRYHALRWGCIPQAVQWGYI